MALYGYHLQSILLVLLLGQGSYAIAGGKDCKPLLPKPLKYSALLKTNTSDAIDFMGELLSEGLISTAHLSRVLQSIKQGKIENLITQQEGRSSTKLEIHREVFESLMQVGLDSVALSTWLEARLEEKQIERLEKTEVAIATGSTDEKIIFRPVKAGRYKDEMAFPEPMVVPHVKLTRSFEMMTTAVTEGQFYEVMGFNPSKVFDSKNLENRFYNGKKVQLAPNHPVQFVNWYQALEFANKLSLREGLKPAFVFERNEKGEIVNVELAEGLNSIYEAEGYRLPTQAEKELVIRKRGRVLGPYFWGNDNSKFVEYAWVKANSEGQTHAVGQLRPFKVDEQEFFDLFGNVWEWTWDDFDPHRNGDDPDVKIHGNARFGRGGSFQSDTAWHPDVPQNFNMSPNQATAYVGFRLVRTLK